MSEFFFPSEAYTLDSVLAEARKRIVELSRTIVQMNTTPSGQSLWCVSRTWAKILEKPEEFNMDWALQLHDLRLQLAEVSGVEFHMSSDLRGGLQPNMRNNYREIELSKIPELAAAHAQGCAVLEREITSLWNWFRQLHSEGKLNCPKKAAEREEESRIRNLLRNLSAAQKRFLHGLCLDEVSESHNDLTVAQKRHLKALEKEGLVTVERNRGSEWVVRRTADLADYYNTMKVKR